MRFARRLKRCFPFLKRILTLSWLVAAVAAPLVGAERRAWQDPALAFRRHAVVNTARTDSVDVVVSEFYTHGALRPENPALSVYALSQPMPYRVLQIGPGDFCRIAFQPKMGTKNYQIYYGTGPPAQSSPSWTATSGLLLETREWKTCDLQRLDSVRNAFKMAKPIGAGYVARVFQRSNPFDVEPAPYLSRYKAMLTVRQGGMYAFFTSSQDCSFLLIDGKLVVAQPGRHRPVGRARFEGKAQLKAGQHRFEYWHAAGGKDTCAVAAWRLPGADKSTRITPIPPKAFGDGNVLHLPLTGLEQHHKGPMADFRLVVQGDAPIEASDAWAVRVQFRAVLDSVMQTGKYLWSFGDGQTSQQAVPTHIYLHPGEYRITLHVKLRGKIHQIASRVWIKRPASGTYKQPGDSLDDYLPVVDTYDPALLDSLSLLQLVRLRCQRYEWAQALEAGKTAFDQDAHATDDAVRWQLVQLLGPVARVRLQAAEEAFDLWKQAGKTIQRGTWRALCALEAADLLLNELLQSQQASEYLKFAERFLQPVTGPDAGKLYRLWGDWYARQSDAEQARANYRKAAEQRTLGLRSVQKNAQRGALSRSTEAFLRDKDLVRAWETLSRWQRDFPADKAEGYLSILLARYWIARKKPKIAIAVAGDLLTVTPRSPYADRLVMVQAEAEQQLGHKDRAVAAYRCLLTEYPGSPLVEHAKQELAKLQP